jgi:hypothetical protein
MLGVGHNTMPLSLDDIHELEVRDDYPAAIDALEERLRADPSERETVIRLGFNLWYAVVEADRMQKQLPTERYATRFMELFREYRSRFDSDADFCWAYGVGISLFWFQFLGADESLGVGLLARAKELDSFYTRMQQSEIIERYRGRGIFAKYYAIAQPITGANAG